MFRLRDLASYIETNTMRKYRRQDVPHRRSQFSGAFSRDALQQKLEK